MKTQILSQILWEVDWSLEETCGAQDLNIGVLFMFLEWATESRRGVCVCGGGLFILKTQNNPPLLETRLAPDNWVIGLV
jgi:hypothetical protein